MWPPNIGKGNASQLAQLVFYACIGIFNTVAYSLTVYDRFASPIAFTLHESISVEQQMWHVIEVKDSKKGIW